MLWPIDFIDHYEFFHFLVNMNRSQRLIFLLRSEAGNHSGFCCLNYNACVRMELVCLKLSVEHRPCVKTAHCVLNVKCVSTVHMARLNHFITQRFKAEAF